MPPKIVDIDSHVLEPTNIWEENIEPKYRDRALRLKTDENGLEYLQVNGVKPRGHFIQGGLLGRD
ncbi:MAG: amidohydrolase, partial [Dehalococcoidia bacterium]